MGVVTGGGGGGGVPSTGSAPFTITETNGTSKGLVVSTQGGFGVNAFEIDAPHTSVAVDGDGGFDITGDDTMVLTINGTGTPAKVEIGSTAAGSNTINLRTDQGLSVSQGSAGAAFYAGIFGIIFTMNAAPASGDLSAGDCALWLDATNGASKLMVKAKSANGTVVTGSLALA